ncbi:MAG: allophanate hydrolase [Flavobacteriaceae bacterium]|nr:allophanate hydrolase [Flavobacteriaceae bacterium]|tara:strand:+ start:4346 stop:5056 length:711 start_codon:yes stop_codon:yes gene_type:complete
MKASSKTYFILNENSILIQYDHPIDSELVYTISNDKINIEKNIKDCIFEIVQSINSLLVIFDKNKVSTDELISELKKTENKDYKYFKSNKIWQIPVCYDIKYAIDIESLAFDKQLSTSEIINIHKSKVYDVLSMGFLPGFMYLGFTNENLHCERKQTPSLDIKKGSVGVALNQTCIYPQNSPGGWHVIGISPVNFFDLGSKTPCFARPGDKIEFIEISNKEYQKMKKEKSLKPNLK